MTIEQGGPAARLTRRRLLRQGTLLGGAAAMTGFPAIIKARAAGAPLSAAGGGSHAAAGASACGPGAAAAEAYRDTCAAGPAAIAGSDAASTAWAVAHDAPLRTEPMRGCLTTLEAVARCAAQAWCLAEAVLPAGVSVSSGQHLGSGLRAWRLMS